MFNMMNMLGKVKEFQAKLKEMEKELPGKQATAETGAGMVTATVNGLRQVVELKIDPSLKAEGDEELLKDLIIGAVNKALEEIEKVIKEEYQKASQDTLPNIPGMDIGSMFGR